MGYTKVPGKEEPLFSLDPQKKKERMVYPRYTKILVCSSLCRRGNLNLVLYGTGSIGLRVLCRCSSIDIDFLVSVRMISDFGVLEWTLAQDGHSRFVVLRCMTWYSYTKVLFDVLLVVSLYR